MGSYTFKWEHPADVVYVSGSFNDWSDHSHKLDKSGTGHEKTIDLPDITDKILYKFVADGTWQHDHTAQTETDHEGNVNNVLYPRDIQPKSFVSQLLSSVGPGATTADMAVENTPGAFPETPAADPDQTFSINPIPASAGAGNPIHLAPGEKVPEPSTINNNTITSSVRDDPSLKSSTQEPEQAFGVAPIPATGGIGNPVHLQPGEKVPDANTLTGNTLTSNVKLDQASYESGSVAPQIPPPLSPQSEREAEGAAIFSGLGPQTTNMIPESSMGMGSNVPPPIDAGPTMSSVGTASTTNRLAGQQSLEPRGVPEVVQDSQKEAHVAPEASANPAAVQEKKEVENELTAKVSQEPAASQNGMAGALAGGVAAAGAAVAGALAYANEKSKDLAGQQSTGPEGVPEVVQDSQKEAHTAPEASANPTAVQEKKEVEDELRAKVSKEPATSQDGIAGAVAGGVAAAGVAVAGALAYANEKTKEATGQDPISALPQSVQDTINANKSSTSPTIGTAVQGTAAAVPSEVKSSQREAHVGPEASANPVAVTEKSAVEKELLNKVPESQATGKPAPVAAAATSATAPAATSTQTSATNVSNTGAPQLAPIGAGLPPISMDDGSKELNAPAGSQAQTPFSKASVLAAEANDSRDVSPMSKPTTAGQSHPVITTGIDSSAAPAESKPVGTSRNENALVGTPGKRNSFMERMKKTPDSQKSPAGSDGKKKGFLSKLKEKLKQ